MVALFSAALPLNIESAKTDVEQKHQCAFSCPDRQKGNIVSLFGRPSKICGQSWDFAPPCKQEQIVLERSARLNLDPGRGD